MKLINLKIDFSIFNSPFFDEANIKFHDEVQKIFGFPSFYGRTMHSFVDCLSDLRFYGHELDGLTNYYLENDESILIEVKNVNDANHDVRYNFFLAIENVNNLCIKKGKYPSILLLLV